MFSSHSMPTLRISLMRKLAMLNLAMRNLAMLLMLFLQMGTATADTVEISATREYFLKTRDAVFTTRDPVNAQLAIPEQAQLTPVTELSRSQTDYWVKFSVVNHTRETRWVLDTGNIIAERLLAHAQNGNRHQIVQQGFQKLWPFDLRYGVQLDLPPGSVSHLWIHIDSTVGAVNPVFSILPQTQYQQKTFSYNTQLLIAIGALVILSVYQLLIFIPTRDWAWFWSALLQLSGALAWSAQAKLLLYGLSAGPWVSLLYLPLFVSAAAGLLFARTYLSLFHPQPLARLLDGLAILTLVVGLIGLLLPAFYYSLLLEITLTITLPAMLGCAIWRTWAGFAANRFFLVGSTLLTLCGFFYLLDQLLQLHIIENDILLATRAQVLAMFAFMLGLIERVNLLQRQRPQQDTRTATDPITRLPNRAAFERDVRAWEAYCKEGILKDFYLTFFDLISLRQTNATRGMREGDRLLALVGTWLQQQTGNHNVYRIGGDEFVVLTQKTFNWDLAPLYQRLQQEGFRDNKINIGTACYSESTGRSSMLKLADDRLHGINPP